ncbi:thermonuclease family protein [Hydrogenovibrio marinus]|uniref:Nuclease n=1 Tax=Hydrogenovibrio marinus TaxID=28885 RepID=A0A067A0T2_HYDMR|nr:thermonuclease family protein [Hydrogenovibrio marinus]KDN95980.1 nuclease [Hydrogenovibrio marinus]
MMLKNFFAPIVISLSSLLLSAQAFAADDFISDCAPAKIDVWTKATYALSGDSLNVGNRIFKLIGIKAPQIEKKQKFYTRGQPLAKEAQDQLNRILANHDMEVGVEYDQQKIDGFNRGLAHLYVKENGKPVSVERLMLESGYVLANSETPNFLHQKCYYAAENRARAKGIALWKVEKDYPDLHYPIAISSQINTQDEGFHIYKGKIILVEKSSNHYILNMDTTGIRVRKDNWKNFDYDRLKSLEGQTIEVRGSGFLYKGAMFVVISSPNTINQLNPAN